MNAETRNTIIKNIIMVSIGIFFLIYFGMLQGSPTLQKQVDDNIEVVPIGQFLGIEGYVGYVILKNIRIIQEKRKLDPTLRNMMTVGTHVFYEYATLMIDLIGIIIISLSFFIYAYPNASPDSFEIMNISNMYFLIFVPAVGFAIHKLLSKRKPQYK